jgi:hypothetical protein
VAWAARPFVAVRGDVAVAGSAFLLRVEPQTAQQV